jgi:hypothetical protein
MFTRTRPARHFHFTDVLQTLSQILQYGMDNCFVQPDATTTQLVPAHNRIEESEVEGTPLPPFFRMTSKLPTTPNAEQPIIEAAPNAEQPVEAVRTQGVQRGTGLEDSKWSFPGLDSLGNRKARGLPRTYREEQRGSWLISDDTGRW